MSYDMCFNSGGGGGMEPVSCHNSNLKKKVSKACKSVFENSTPCKKGFATLKKEIIA